MIYGDVSGVELFKGQNALYQSLLFWRDKAAGLPDGRHDLADGMFAQIKHYSPAPREERRYEAHIKYADIQCVLEGEEMIYVRPIPGLTIQEDALAERDVVFYDQPADGVTELPCLIRPGFFILLYPEDAHKPECLVSASPCRKLVIKIPMSLLI